MDASKFGIQLLGTINGRGGLICIDGSGRIGYAHNTPAMTFHYIE